MVRNYNIFTFYDVKSAHKYDIYQYHLKTGWESKAKNEIDNNNWSHFNLIIEESLNH